MNKSKVKIAKDLVSQDYSAPVDQIMVTKSEFEKFAESLTQEQRDQYIIVD
tara:strand:- start:6826 stop:6978 length:153 start_codon:yes stop_codon:yes gene_type:complete